jgi:CRISPR-associated endonuclease/helicase Cas3
MKQPSLRILDEESSLDHLREMDASSILAALGSKARVYSPYVLLRSLEVWKANSEVEIPSQIRPLIEATYETHSTEPATWTELRKKTELEAEAHRRRALQSANIWNLPLSDHEGVQTRLNELPTVDLVLCQEVGDKSAVFVNGAEVAFGGATHNLRTARAIHCNLVRVPRHWFDGIGSHPSLKDYLYSQHVLGIVSKDGRVTAVGSKPRGTIRWSSDIGVFLEKE